MPNRTVDRPHLRARLDRALESRLTVVVAPAGAGKSVLLNQWVISRPDIDFVWLGLVPADDDAAHLANRLLSELTAIRTDFPDIAPLVAIGAGGLGLPFTRELSSELEDRGDICLVFDDFHALSNPLIVADLETLISESPQNIHVVLSSRSEPAGDLSRYRLRGEMTELRQYDLAMSYADSAELLAHAAGRELSPDNITALVDKTEGWAAGLQLAGLTISLRDDTDAFVADFSGSDRLVSDYLSQQVLGSLSKTDRQSILSLGALDTMSSELVRAAFDDPTVLRLFEQLAKNTQFVIALDDRREHFRFHHLFRDLLRFHLRAEHPQSEAAICERAAAWHLARGEVDATVDYLMRAQRWAEVLEVVLSRGSEVFERGQIATVVGWLEQVPEHLRVSNLDASLYLGILVGLLGRGVRADDILVRVVNDPQATLGQKACGLAFLAALVQTRPNARRSVRAARQALDLIEMAEHEAFPNILRLTSRSSLETIALVSGARASFFDADFAEARLWLARALASDGATYSLWRINTLGSLALVEAWAGNLVRADELATEALATARESGMLPHWASTDAYIANAHVALERGEPTQASLSLHEAQIRAEATQRTQQLWVIHFERCLLMESTAGDQPLTKPAGVPPRVVLDRLSALSLRLNRAGKASPHQFAEAPREGETVGAAVLFERGLDAVAHNRADRVSALLTELTMLDDKTQPSSTVQRLLLTALRPSQSPQSAASVRALNETLTLAAGQQLVELVVRAGPDMVNRVAASSHADSRFRERVLQRARDVNVSLPGSDLDEPLTRRELEILSYLPSRYTNNELAEMTFVSTSTIKTHVLHIYQKLGVGTRKGAINRARELGLL